MNAYSATLSASAPSREASASEVPAGLVPLVVLVPEGVAGVLGEYGAEHAMSASELAAQTILEKWAPHLVEFGMGAP